MEETVRREFRLPQYIICLDRLARDRFRIRRLYNLKRRYRCLHTPNSRKGLARVMGYRRLLCWSFRRACTKAFFHNTLAARIFQAQLFTSVRYYPYSLVYLVENKENYLLYKQETVFSQFTTALGYFTTLNRHTARAVFGVTQTIPFMGLGRCVFVHAACLGEVFAIHRQWGRGLTWLGVRCVNRFVSPLYFVNYVTACAQLFTAVVTATVTYATVVTQPLKTMVWWLCIVLAKIQLQTTW